MKTYHKRTLSFFAFWVTVYFLWAFVRWEFPLDFEAMESYDRFFYLFTTVPFAIMAYQFPGFK